MVSVGEVVSRGNVGDNGGLREETLEFDFTEKWGRCWVDNSARWLGRDRNFEREVADC